MTKAELIRKIANQADLSQKESEIIVNLVLKNIMDAVKEEGKADFAGFGKFEKKHRAARTGINPATKQKITIPATDTIGFKPAKVFKEIFTK